MMGHEQQATVSASESVETQYTSHTRPSVRRVALCAVSVLLLGCISVGLALRCIGVWVYAADSGDEWGNTMAPLRMLFEHGDPVTFFHPSFYYDLTAAAYTLVFGALKLLGTIQRPDSMADVLVKDRYVFICTARAVSALSGALAIWLQYRFGKSLWQRTNGLLAAALLAAFPLHILYSTTVRVDGLFVVVLLCAAAALLRTLAHPGPPTSVGTGLLIGLAIGTNYNGAFLLPWFLVAHALSDRSLAGGATGRQRVRNFCLGLLAAVAGFLVSSPFVVLDWQVFVRNSAFISGLSVSTHPGWEGRGGGFYVDALAQAQPLLLGVIVATSCAIALFGTRAERFLLSLPVGYLVLFSLMPTKDERFMLPAMTLFLLLAPGLPFVLQRRWRAHPAFTGLLGASAYAALVACLGSLLAAALQRSPYGEHPMLVRPEGPLLEWIETHVARDSSILIESGIVPLIDTMKEPGPFAAALRQSMIAWRPGLQQRFVGAVYVGGCNYDPAAVTRKTIDYAIIAPRTMRYIEDHCDRFPQVCAFYAALRSLATPVFTTPDTREPVVIYQIRGQGARSDRDAEPAPHYCGAPGGAPQSPRAADHPARRHGRVLRRRRAAR